MSIEKFTYRDLTKTNKREEMLYEKVSSLGTQAGGFGVFTEQARLITLSGSNQIKKEITEVCGFDLEEIYEACPTLKDLIK